MTDDEVDAFVTERLTAMLQKEEGDIEAQFADRMRARREQAEQRADDSAEGVAGAVESERAPEGLGWHRVGDERVARC